VKARFALAAGVLLSMAAISCGKEYTDLPDGLYAVIETQKGDIVIQLEPDRAPLTTMNFVGLAEGTITSNAGGKPFYDGLTFHRVEPGFLIQGGDPEGRGTGGPGYRFPTETHPDLLHDAPGVVAMANSGPDSNGSQFYITMSATPYLDGAYNVFGHVISGMETVAAIEVGDVMTHVKIVRRGDIAEAYQASDLAFGQLRDQAAEKRAAAAVTFRSEQERLIRRDWPDAKTVGDGGLLLKRTAAGNGRRVSEGDTVSVHFTFELLDGTVIDDTRPSDQPYRFVFGIDRLLPGLEMAIGQIDEGGSGVAIVPPELGFPAGRQPSFIEPGSYLVFRIDVIAIE